MSNEISSIFGDLKRASRRRLGAVAVAFALAAGPAQAATAMFLDFGPEIRGESRDKFHAGQVDVLAWSWGVSNSANLVTGGAGRASFQDLSFTKYVDKASPALMLRCAKGQTVAQATLIVRSGADKPLEYIKITMTEVLVSSVSTGGSTGEDRLTENDTFYRYGSPIPSAGDGETSFIVPANTVREFFRVETVSNP